MFNRFVISKPAKIRLSELNANWFKPDLNWIRLFRSWNLPRGFGNTWKRNSTNRFVPPYILK